VVEDKRNSFLVKITGKNASVLMNRIKGYVRDRVKMAQKYSDAAYSAGMKDGKEIWLRVQGVPKDVLNDALEKCQSSLLPNNRVDFDILVDEGQVVPEANNVEEEAQRLFSFWIQESNRGYAETIKGYEAEIARQSKETQQLNKEKDALQLQIRQEKDRTTKLLESFNQASSLLQKMSSESVRPPLQAGKLWVGDWSVVAARLEQEIGETGFSGGLSDIKNYLAFDLQALRAGVKKEVGDSGEVPENLEGIEALARVGTWEETGEYRSLAPEYERAASEDQFIQQIREGHVQVPDSLKEKLISTVDVEHNKRVMFEFESKETAYRTMTSASGRVSALVARFKAAEALRGTQTKIIGEGPIPVMVSCHKDSNKWKLEVLLPSSDGMMSSYLKECVLEACKEEDLRKVAEERMENFIQIDVVLPGTVSSCKDACKRQESLALEFARRFNAGGLHELGLRLNLFNIAEVTSE